MLKKKIENGIEYVLVNDYYVPSIVLEQKEYKYQIRRYGRKIEWIFTRNWWRMWTEIWLFNEENDAGRRYKWEAKIRASTWVDCTN